MDAKSIKEKIEMNDWKMVAQITGKTREACRQSMYRQTGSTYEIVIKVLEKIIENREAFLKSFNKSTH